MSTLEQKRLSSPEESNGNFNMYSILSVAFMFVTLFMHICKHQSSEDAEYANSNAALAMAQETDPEDIEKLRTEVQALLKETRIVLTEIIELAGDDFQLPEEEIQEIEGMVPNASAATLKGIQEKITPRLHSSKGLLQRVRAGQPET